MTENYVSNLQEESLPKNVLRVGELPLFLGSLYPANFKQTKNIKSVEQEALISKLNYFSFKDEQVSIQLRHPRYRETLLIKVYIEPCTTKELKCRLSDDNLSGLILKEFTFETLVIDDGRSLIISPIKLKEINGNSFSVELPSLSYLLERRELARHRSTNVKAELIQAGLVSEGELLDFNSNVFKIKLSRISPGSLCCNLNSSVTIILRREGETLFAGKCKIIRSENKLRETQLVLSLTQQITTRFRKKRARNPRLQLNPSPAVSFGHPFSQKCIQMEVSDISNSGFSVYENPVEGTLLPGTIITGMELYLTGGLRIDCTAQVIYREREEKGVRCGLAILDMDLHTYTKLNDILSHALDANIYVSRTVDMDSLWEFFFKSGFIYPQKSLLIHTQRNEFRKTYLKLYQNQTDIAEHFTFQKNGRVYGHISMVRAYERTWLLQHHVAIAAENKRPGFIVLKQLSHFLNDMYRLPSLKTDYVMCYFRPENRFPDRVFGGFARELNEPRLCSMDLFCYWFHDKLSQPVELPRDWSIKESSPLDLWHLQRFYADSSGGLLLDALGLCQESDIEIEDICKQNGFLRKWKAYSLVRDGSLNAIIIANQSDPGLNLSGLLNGLKIIITDPIGLPYKALIAAIAKLASIYTAEKIPILLYPTRYMEAKKIPFDKLYQCLIWDASVICDFIDFMQNKFRVHYWK